MRKRGDMHCINCRDVGGKHKSTGIYVQEGFTVKSVNTGKISYICNKCDNIVIRGTQHARTSEYIVCEHCRPRLNIGAKFITPEGEFDSKFEHLAYLKLVSIISKEYIIRQKSYNELFNTGTKHTADFYIEKLDLVLEVTTSSNNLSNKYKETVEWKLNVNPKVKFAYSIREVEDIVRPLAKAKG